MLINVLLNNRVQKDGNSPHSRQWAMWYFVLLLLQLLENLVRNSGTKCHCPPQEITAPHFASGVNNLPQGIHYIIYFLFFLYQTNDSFPKPHTFLLTSVKIKLLGWVRSRTFHCGIIILIIIWCRVEKTVQRKGWNKVTMRQGLWDICYLKNRSVIWQPKNAFNYVRKFSPTLTFEKISSVVSIGYNLIRLFLNVKSHLPWLLMTFCLSWALDITSCDFSSRGFVELKLYCIEQSPNESWVLSWKKTSKQWSSSHYFRSGLVKRQRLHY